MGVVVVGAGLSGLSTACHLAGRRHDVTVFAGSGTVPGVGVPMVLLSGRLAAERVEARR